MTRRRLAAGLTLAVGLLLGGGLAPAAGATEHRRVVDFWTVDRVRQAVPRDFVLADRGFVSKGKPGGGGDGSTAGASWTKAGAVLVTTGKVFFQMGASYYVCSGNVISDGASDRSVVLTAGHCVYDEAAGQFATNWVFIPGYDLAAAPLDGDLSFCAQTTYGCWTASALVVHSGYATAGSFNTQATLHDWGFAVLGFGGKATPRLVEDAIGVTMPTDFGGGSAVTVSAFGYPASGKYKGADLVYCRGPLTTDPKNDNLTWGVRCTMTGGSSGGPWLRDMDDATGVGTQMSVNSYGYGGASVMYGPKLNSRTAATYAAALSAQANTVASGG